MHNATWNMNFLLIDWPIARYFHLLCCADQILSYIWQAGKPGSIVNVKMQKVTLRQTMKIRSFRL
jgi:hypothetical protein